MVKLSLVDLVAITFIELNKDEDIRYVSLQDVMYLNELLELNASLENINYEFISSIKNFYELRFLYNALFNFYEDSKGYIIELKKDINIYDLYNYFKHLYSYEVCILIDSIDFKNNFKRVR